MKLHGRKAVELHHITKKQYSVRPNKNTTSPRKEGLCAYKIRVYAAGSDGGDDSETAAGSEVGLPDVEFMEVEPP